MRRWSYLTVVLGLGVAGCAAGSGRQHEVALSSDPPGARCTVTNSSMEALTELEATPGTIRLPVSPRNVRVVCTRPGYLPASAALPSIPDGGTMATYAVAGGLTGLATAALSGQGYRYAPALHVAMEPARFGTAAERDRYFAERARETQEMYDAQIRVHRSMCRPDEFGCQQVIASMIRARDAELAQLEALRAATRPQEEGNRGT